MRRGIGALVESIRRLGIRSVAVLALGCGAGGLTWDVVERLLVDALGELADVEVLLFAPAGTPAPGA